MTVNTAYAQTFHAGTIDASFLKALKDKALDSIVFMHENNNENKHDDGIGRIRLNIRPEGTRTETVIELPVRSFIRAFGERRDYAKASCVELNPRYGSALGTTMKGLLRKGDVIRLEWYADNRNLNYDGVNWTADELYLTIERKDRTIARLLASYYVGPDNSARFMR